MKSWPLTVVLLGVGLLIPALSFAQDSDLSEFVGVRDFARIRFKGIVDEVQRRICPISGGMDSHLMVDIGNEIYEVHLHPLNS